MRKRFLKKMYAVSMIGILAASTMLAGCGDSSSEKGSEEKTSESNKDSGDQIEIKLSTTWTQGSVAQDNIAELIADFEKEHPNVKIEHDALSTGDLRTKLTVQAASGDMPDVSWCPQSYAREFIKDGLIIDWADIVEEDPDWHQWFADPVLEALTETDGKILLAPLEASIDGLYYNKAMFDEHGWTAPKTWDEFMALIPQIKEAGITPLVTGGKDSRFAWMASAFLVRSGGLDNFRSLCYGDDLTNWNDESTGFPTAVAKFKEMVDAGAFPNGVMVKAGNDAEKEKLCVELAKAICSPDFGIPLMEEGGQVYPGVAEYDRTTCSEIMNKMIEAFHAADSYIPSMDGIAPPAVDLAIKQTAFPGIITGELDVQQAVDEVQKAAEDYAASLKNQ